MNGILLIDKPKDYTSHDIVAMIKKLTNEKVGHTGTLDPNATGLLPLLIGNATRISKYLINHNKAYIATLQLGIKTDTADSEGKILEEQDISKLLIDKEKIIDVFNSMLGKQEQLPPMYSAVKINGKKLYEYARKGKTVDIKTRNIEIYAIKLLELNIKQGQIVFEVECSKGTYIRTLCENIAEKLNTIGYMKDLRRTCVGKFEIKNSIHLEEINHLNSIEDILIPIETVFEEKEKIELSNKDLSLFLNGVKLKTEKRDNLYRIYHNHQFIGLGIVKEKLLKRDIVIINN